jgi:predicted nucleotidyltransferase
MNYTLKEIEERGMIIFSAIMGSKAYGTSLPISDTDIRGIFIQPLDDILLHGYVEQVSDEKNDIIFYELRRFMHLVSGNNPNILELLNAPEDCILISSQDYKKIYLSRDKFLSKICQNSFGGYAIQQIKKSRGYDKKINWEESEMVRKEVLDFCYVLQHNGTVPLLDYFARLNENQGISSFDVYNFGLSKMDHAHDLYAAYDLTRYNQRKGIISRRPNVNDVQIVSIPKEAPVSFYMTFNKDAYSTHCKRYKEYQEWLEKRNEDRFKMNKAHGKNYDSKNMSHTIRLLNVAIEIATQKEIIVRRTDDEIKILMSIRRGEMEYDDLLEKAESLMKKMDSLFDSSDLPETPDIEFIKNLQFEVRRNFYLRKGQMK